MEPEEDRAVVDRVADGVAVLLVGEEETEHTVPAGDLPPDVVAGSWVRVRLRPRVEILERVDPAVDRDDLARRMERIRQERRSGRFDR